MDTDRNLLFGVLALQADLLTAAQFAEACSAWAGRKETPLADLLVDRGWLAPGDRTDVEKLLQRKLAKHSGNAKSGLAELTTDQVRQSLASLNDPDVRQSLAGPTPPPQGHVLLATTAYVPEALDRYTLSRLHATGGIGRVWLARDASLGRDVALKELRPERAGQPAVWARFLREAQVTGQLEHPGIVPVYEVGRRPDDQVPFYTMRFVRGRTLTEAARTYHERRARGEVGPLELRGLLTAVVGVCNAVAYAHSRGVLHRDLKPQNVVLGDYGEVIVLDWGLAKVMGEAEGAGAADRPPVALAGAGSRDETMAGQVLGTPAYMAPEQAEGRLDLLDVRTDVYGLGAILYEVLTGKPPFAGDQTEVVLQRVLHELPEPPRRSVPSTPRALEAVCLKALAKKPADRSGSAKELADEVQHWLADEPVAAYREPILARAGRWVRRHRTLSAVAAAMLVVGAVGLGVNNWLVNRQRARAEENARMAREAVDDMYTQVAEKWLSQEAQLEETQREFLEKALRFYERLAASEDDSPEIRREAGKAAQRAAEIQFKLGDSDAAARSFQRSVALLDGLPSDDLARAELASTHNIYGWYLWTVGKRPDEEFQRALEIGEELAARRPDLVLVRRVLGRAHSSFAIIQAARGQFKEAEASHGRAVAIRAALQKEFPNDPVHRSNEARTHSHLVSLYRQIGRFRDADNESARAVEIIGSLVKEFPRDPNNRADLAHDLDERAYLVALFGKREEAEALLRQATDLTDRLVADFPGHPVYRDLASTARRDLAVLRRNQVNSRAAEPDLRRAIANAEELTRKHPEFPNYWRTLAVNHGNLGDLLHTNGRPAESQAEYTKALAIADDIASRQPDILDYRYLRTAYQSSVAFMYLVTGQTAEADAAYERVVADLEAQVQQFPGMPNLRALLASACMNRARVPNKRSQDGQRLLERATALAEGLIQEFELPRYQVPSYHVIAIGSLIELAETALSGGDVDRTRMLLERADRHLAVVLKLDADSTSNRYYRLRSLGLLAQLQAKAGDLRAADATAREMEAIPRQGIDHLNTCAFLGDVARAVRQSAAPEPERNLLARALTDRAFVQLQKAIALGYRNLAMISSQEVLKDREDYNELVDQVKEELIAKQKEAVRLNPKDALARVNLGNLLRDKGDFEGAIAEYQEALRLDAKSAAAGANLRSAERKRELLRRLPDVAAGRSPPESAAEALELCQLCVERSQRRYVDAARVWEKAFAADAKTLTPDNRYNAACSTALAAAGRGRDAAGLSVADRSALRAKALDWLKADLTWLRQRTTSAKSAECQEAAVQLAHRLRDTDLDGVRPGANREGWTKDEAAAWDRYWADVRAALDVAKAAAPQPNAREEKQ